MSIPARILAILGDEEKTFVDIASRMPDVKEGRFAPVMMRLVNDERLMQPRRGCYRAVE